MTARETATSEPVAGAKPKPKGRKKTAGTVRVVMAVEIPGYTDAQRWPKRGGEIELPKSVADHVLEQGYGHKAGSAEAKKLQDD